MTPIAGPCTQLNSLRCFPVLAGRHGYNEGLWCNPHCYETCSQFRDAPFLTSS